MDLIGDATRRFAGALSHVDTAALTPFIAVGTVLAVGIWLVARRRKGGRA